MMMKYYLDITLITGAEADLGFIWQKVYQQLHIALVDNKIAENTSAIAICFPLLKMNNEFPLGNKLRLFSKDQATLDKLMIEKWLSRLSDYIHLTSIKLVPLNIEQFARIKRKQFSTNIYRLARRRAKRKGESIELALQHFEGFEDKETKLPFINVKSLSKGEQFRLFIEQEKTRKQCVGEFNCYGLSKVQATVPWF